MDFRVGFGYDVHRLVPGRELFLGGVKIPFDLGLLGHSDADVLLHAVCDAILGAAGLGDIGMHFPDSDHRYKGISSLLLLKEVTEKIGEKGFRLNNLDATIVAQAPKVGPYIPKMRENISKCSEVEVERINVKATTTEGLGFAGKKEGIASYCTVTLLKL